MPSSEWLKGVRGLRLLLVLPGGCYHDCRQAQSVLSFSLQSQHLVAQLLLVPSDLKRALNGAYDSVAYHPVITIVTE